MASATPLTGVLKLINKFLVQAKKIDSIEPVVAYYTRLHAITVAMKNKSTKADSLVIAELMNWCESHSAAVKGVTKEEARQRMETFSLQVFQHADNEDRSGLATKSTAASFYTAYIFMESCKQFGELDSDIAEKIKYAMWKSADLTKAFKEGRIPTAGPPTGTNENEFDNGNNNNISGVGSNSGGVDLDIESKYNQHEEQKINKNNNFNAPPVVAAAAPVQPVKASNNHPATNPFADASAPPSVESHHVAATAPPAYPQPANSNPFSHPAADFHPTPQPQPKKPIIAAAPIIPHTPIQPLPVVTSSRIQACKDADRLIRHAQSALSFDDVDTTIDKLQQTMQILMQFKGQKPG